MTRDERKFVERLLEHVREHEWLFEDTSGYGYNYCGTCGATYRTNVFSREHKIGCELKKLLDEARVFFATVDNNN